MRAGVCRHAGRRICRGGGGPGERGRQGKPVCSLPCRHALLPLQCCSLRLAAGGTGSVHRCLECESLWCCLACSAWRALRALLTHSPSPLLAAPPRLQLSESADLEAAAGLLIAYGTAWLALRERADLRPGEGAAQLAEASASCGKRSDSALLPGESCQAGGSLGPQPPPGLWHCRLLSRRATGRKSAPDPSSPAAPLQARRYWCWAPRAAWASRRCSLRAAWGRA